MDNAGAPETPPRVPTSAIDDIPMATRESPVAKPKPRVRKPVLIAGLTGIGCLALLAGVALAVRLQQSPAPPQLATSPAVEATPAVQEDTLLGHYAYAEAPPAELATVEGSIKLRKAAAQAFKEMTAAAQAEGVSLVPISGFRSIADQKYLYFKLKEERNQTAVERAKVSAPPGYSEHHTGYAIDIGDGNAPATELRPDFDRTAAFRWLKENAARYSFEISFPKKNRQGVSYEPWHWRFTGDGPSLKTFEKAMRPK